jgi:hypothetical protein
MAVARVMQPIGRDDDVAVSLAGLIEVQAVLGKSVICGNLVFELAVDFKAANDILINPLSHAAADDKDIPMVGLEPARKIGSASGRPIPGSEPGEIKM